MAEPNKGYRSNEQADVVSRVFGLVLLCIGFGIAYLVWPTGMADTTLAAVTIGALLRAIAAFVIGIVSLFVAVMFWM